MEQPSHLFLPLVLLTLVLSYTKADQAQTMYQTFKSIRSTIPPAETKLASPIINLLMSQDGLKQADKITSLPGQPAGVTFQQYAGYVTVDPEAGKALFYYFVESPENSSSKPLILWLNGGPGCSSVGYGAMTELGPFRVRGDGKTLFSNKYAWNNVGNVIFLESPAGVGFSYSNRTSDYDHTGDISTANDAYTFLINWLERFPEYKSREFYITGESYAGHYVPQLAQTILLRNKNATQIINLRGIAIGNAWIDDLTSQWGVVDYVWTHALISDQTHQGIHKYCNFMNSTNSEECSNFMTQANEESGSIYAYNIYAPLCKEIRSKLGSVNDFDPCSDKYITHYLNLPEVQASLHVRPTQWSNCRNFDWAYWQPTLLPTIKNLINAGLRVWIYSGDVDAVVPVTSTRYSINNMTLEIKEQWRPWYTNGEVGGYVVVYAGLTFATVRGAGHTVPTYQPERALVLVSSFLQGSFSSSSSSMFTHILGG